MSYDSKIEELNESLASQEKQIYELREKLSTYNEMVAMRDELQDRFRDLKKWIEDVQTKNKVVEKELLVNTNVKMEKLRKAERNEYELRGENNKLQDSKDCMCEQLNALENNERKLKYDVESLKQCINSLENQLCSIKEKTDKLKCVIENLTQTFQCKEEECNEMSNQIDVYKIACGRLNDKCTSLELDLKYANADMEKVKSYGKQIEEKLKFEQDTLTSELQIKCQKMHELEVEYKEAKLKFNEEKAQVKKLESQMAELQEYSEKQQCHTRACIEKLKKDNAVKDESLCRLQNQMKEIQRDNESMVSEIESLRTQVQTNECMLEKIKCSTESLEQMKDSQCNELERDRDSLTSDVQHKMEQIAELEQKTCYLQQEILERETSKCLQETVYCPPKPMTKACSPPELEFFRNACCPPANPEDNCPLDKCSSDVLYD